MIGQYRATQRRVLRLSDDEEALRERIVTLATRYGRYGYRRITALLRRDGWQVNHKRVERIWRQEGLKVPQKQPKRGRLELNDGSCLNGLQVIADKKLPNYETEILKLQTGCSVRIQGVLTESPGKGQSLELQAEELEVLGWADPDLYPLQKKRHSFEFLRTIAHLRPRTNTFGAVARVRNTILIADMFIPRAG